ncbi:hypothetical protein MM236_17085 [Belliella sp. DSM 107340]|uniref:Transmembrane protein n=1 Tax=Belliella calami TaxID=2923436 RepID=A0ABS9UTF1_9BACT|nr:hypothetical protein [Belliella calami]MCH7399714.1 hypothetical protein [Belliella calami]
MSIISLLIKLRPLKTVLKIGLLWASLWLPVFLFEKIFTRQFETHQLIGVYRDASMVYLSISVLLAIIYLWLTPRWFQSSAYKTGIILIYVLFFAMMCTQVAKDYCINFGSTWRWNEVFYELVATQWYLYVIGLIGVISHLLCHHILIRNKKKLLDNRNHKSLCQT